MTHTTVGHGLAELGRTKAIIRETVSDRRRGPEDRRARPNTTDRRHPGYRHCPSCHFERPGWPHEWANAGVPGHTVYVCADCVGKAKIEST